VRGGGELETTAKINDRPKRKKKKFHGVHTSTTSKEHVEQILGRHFLAISAMGVCESSTMVMVSCWAGSVVVDARALSFIGSMLIENSSLLWVAQNSEGLGYNYENQKRQKRKLLESDRMFFFLSTFVQLSVWGVGWCHVFKKNSSRWF